MFTDRAAAYAALAQWNRDCSTARTEADYDAATIPTEADNLAHSVRNAVEALRCAADSARYLGRHEQSTRYTFLAYKVAATITTTTKGTS